MVSGEGRPGGVASAEGVGWHDLALILFWKSSLSPFLLPSACLISSALGCTTGIMELTKAFVMLEERPVIFIGVGI